MRLVDADALEKWIADRVKNYHKSFPDWRKTHPISVETALMELDCIKDVVRETPTIDAAPVVHARWDETNCTACGKSYMEYAEGCSYPAYCEGELYTPDFCPHCGAKMDGGAADG